MTDKTTSAFGIPCSIFDITQVKTKTQNNI